MDQIGKAFLKREPPPVKFGTSGMRGTAVDLTDLECYVNTRGFIEFLKNISPEDGGIKEGAEIYLAGDFRPSTPRIMKAIARAAADSGCAIRNCGNMSSPAVAYCGMRNNCASVMVTGSHIPEDRNGIKPNKTHGEILKYDEAPMLQCVAEAREKIYATLGQPEGKFNADGMFIDDFSLPEVDTSQAEIYIRRYTDVFPADCLQGKKIVVYEHSSVGRDAVTEIFRKLGADIVIEGRTDQFVSVDTEALKENDIKLMREWAEKHHPFALISFDGDCDRPWLSNEYGEFLPGGVLGGLMILYLGADFGAVPITVSDAVDTILESKAKLVKTKIGSPYVIEKMMDAAKQGFKKIAGWEVNGGFMTYSDFEFYGKKLAALPTRDAVLPLLCIILSAIEKNTTLSEIMNGLPKRYTDINKIKDFPFEIAEKINTKYSPEDSRIDKIEFYPEEILVTHKDGAVETMKKDSAFWNEWLEKKKIFEEKYLLPNGMTKIMSFVYTDGLRIFTENKEVIHLRESANAPEMRCYSVADSKARAAELVDIGLTKIVPQLKADLA
ncbi:MAG: phosphomannomutase [Patescibacteria group bacterium]|nr:phosphomannomutase [Patescibacteria group bacterium]